jgi:hypothetical protein
MQLLHIDQFATHLNDTFQVDVAEGLAPFVLVEVQPLKGPSPASPAAMRAGFSLLFHNTAAIVFPQRIYAMRHAQMGEFGIFLVAIARDQNGFIYQAVFN